MDRFGEMAAFVAIADGGSFVSAARSLRSSPPAMTRAIAGLEERLGVRLLHRTTRSLRPTDEGALFLARARQILADMEDAERAVMGRVTHPRGLLAITAPVVFGRLHVLPVVANLLLRHAGLAVRVLLIDRTVQLVEEGVDVAVRIGPLADGALRAVKVGEVRRVLVASPDYLESRGTPCAVDDLRGHDVIAFTGISRSDEWRFGRDGRSAVRISPRLTVNGADGAIAAAAAGLGITRVLSYQVQAEVEAGRLRIVLAEAEPPAIPVSCLFQAARGATPNVRAFLDLATSTWRKTAF